MHHTTKTSFATDHEPAPRHNSSLFDVDGVNSNQGDSSTIKANSTNQEHSNKEREDSRWIYCSLFLKKEKIHKSSDEYKGKHSKEMDCSTTTTCSSLSSSTPHQSESVPELGKSSSKRRHLSMFRNLINCAAAVSTNDAAFIRLNRNTKTSYSFKPPNRNSKEVIIIHKKSRDTAACAVDGSAGNFRTSERP